jgi:hypothetical protein
LKSLVRLFSSEINLFECESETLLFPGDGILAIQAVLRNKFILEKYPVLLQALLHPQSQKGKQMKRFMLAAAFACVLSATVIAGEIPTTGAPIAGEIPTTGAQIAGEIPTTGALVAPPSASCSAVVAAILQIIGIVL